MVGLKVTSRLASGQPSNRRLREAPIYAFLAGCAALSLITTVGIVMVLVGETMSFFNSVSPFEFLTGTEWTPLFLDKSFGVLPLLSATLLMTGGALLIAVPIGLGSALYLSEYARPVLRSVLKPVLEVLAGIPTVVYGFFALEFISPHVVRAIAGQSTGVFNAASASIAMAIMVLPMVASLSEDAMEAVPRSLREGAYALGANDFEVSTRIVVPAALSGIAAGVMLAAARAAGETMIVTIAAGQIANLSWNPLEAMQAMTAYIVQVSLGDTPRGTIEYSSIFAIGTMLFATTLVLNLAAQWLIQRFREVYE